MFDTYNSIRTDSEIYPDRRSLRLDRSRAECTIFDVIAGHAARQPDRSAILASGLEPLSFKDLIVLIESIWRAFNEGGIGYGARVGIALPSGPESAIAILAIASRAICVPLNPHLSERELDRELERFRLDALILPDWSVSAAQAAAERSSFGLFAASKISSEFSSFGLQCLRAVQGPRRQRIDISGDATTLVLRTSATTGPAKLVPVTHGNMLELARKLSGWFGFSAQDRGACVLPTYYAAGAKLNVLIPSLLGEGIAIPINVRPERLAEWISDLKPTWFLAGPTFLQAALDGLRSRREPIPKHVLRFIMSGSAHLPNGVRTGLEDILGCPILEMYAISEAGIMAANPAPPAKRKSGTVGLIAPGELAIRGAGGEILPPGESGEIFVSGPSMMPGYIDDREPVGAGLQDGWLRTGDIGSVDSDGFLTLVGRTKEVINRGAEKISPYEVENALLLHPSVCEAAAFPVPHPRLGENVAAAVVLQPEAATTSLELRRFLRGRLAAFKIPQRIDIASSLPKGHTGKVLRTQLAQAASRREQRINPPEQPLDIQILEIWQRLLQRDDIGVHDDFFEAGGDSLLATQMLLEVEAVVGHRVTQSALAQAFTIRQLTEIAIADAGGDDELVTKAKDGAGTPFFFCHGDMDTRGFYALKLAALLKPDQPVYLIQPLRDVDETSELVVEDMARLYLPRLLSAQPDGKFRLGGFCNGGLLAWEIAHQLIRAGREIESVALVDSLSLNSRPLFRGLLRLLHGMAAVTWAKTTARRLRRKSMPAIWYRARQSGGSKYRWIAHALQSLGRRLGRRNRTAKPFMSQSDMRVDSYLHAMANYMPPKLDCEVVAIVCEQNADTFEWSTEPWTRVARDVHRMTVPGEHFTCITTHVEALAQALNGRRHNRKQ